MKGLAVVLLLAVCGCGAESSSRTSAQLPPESPVMDIFCATEPGGPLDLYRVRCAVLPCDLETWPEATGTHGTYCPPRTNPNPPFCMWQSYDELRGQYISVYGDSCEVATEQPATID
jgi:hypothetical protein